MKPLRLVFLLLLLVGFPAILSADGLYLIHVQGYENQRALADNPAFKIHLYKENWVIASSSVVPKAPHQLLDAHAWTDHKNYFVVYLPAQESKQYSQSRPFANILFQNHDFIIVLAQEDELTLDFPYKNDGVLRISPTEARLAERGKTRLPQSITPDPFVQGLIDQVTAANITASVQHLQDYGTRNAYHPKSVEAQNWLKDQFEAMGLSVELQDFPMPSGNASDNVIATLTGAKYPDEYVVVGSHFDSYTMSGSAAPGADDNASGTAGVLEIARILSQHTFDRSIVFCSFSGEEYGLYGSDAYATRAAQQGMDIHGYFNLDMTGYLKPGNTTIKSTLIFPPSAQELGNFYLDVVAAYLPDFMVQPGSFSGGDSDHTSFNNNGFMGIFPFEPVPDYSPYIHTANDVVGTSYNSESQAAVFTKASLAAVVTMANRLNPPRGLVAMPGDGVVDLNWAPLPDAASFKVYRNGQMIQAVTSNNYSDTDVTNGNSYTYYVTAIYSATNEESEPSNSVTVIPMPPLSLPFFNDFESGAPYWEFTGAWGLSTTQAYSPTHSISDSPIGQYQNNVTSYAYLRPFALNLGYSSAEVSFWTRYDIENNYDYAYFEISTDGSNWTTLGQFTGTQSSWQKKTYSLNNYLDKPFVKLRFRFTSDFMVTKDGIYIDDFVVNTTGNVYTQNNSLQAGWNTLSSYVIPADPSLTAVFAPLGNKLEAVQTLNGVYIPAQSLNTIGSWTSSTGYKVKLNQSANLAISGQNLADNTVQLQAGWNLLPVLSAVGADVEALFAGQLNRLVMLKEMGTNQVYWPGFQATELHSLLPSRAYLVKLSEPVAVVFPTGSKSDFPMKERSITETMITPNTHIVGLSSQALTIANSGDFIMAFNQQNLLTGQFEVQPGLKGIIAIAGNDSLSSAITGMQQGEAIRWKLFNPVIGNYTDLTATYDNQMPEQGFYQHEGISLVTAFTADAVGLQKHEWTISIYPNPVGDILHLVSASSEIDRIKITDIRGVVLKTFRLSETGSYDVSDLASGTYILQLEGSNAATNRLFIKK